jgi:quercetin dioxygenase-like cupin family protein
MDRRRFLEISTIAALGVAPVKEAVAMGGDVKEMAGMPLRIAGPEDARVYTLAGGGEARLMATGENTNGTWWMGRFREDPGFMTHYHYHPNTDEQFYVLEGVLSLYTDGKWHELGPESLGVMPKGKPHAQGNRGNVPVHLIGTGAPAGFEQMFPAMDDLIKRAKPGSPEFIAEFQKISARCDIVSLGPAPK